MKTSRALRDRPGVQKIGNVPAVVGPTLDLIEIALVGVDRVIGFFVRPIVMQPLFTLTSRWTCGRVAFEGRFYRNQRQSKFR